MQTSETALRTFRRRRSIPKGTGSGAAEPSAARHPAEPNPLPGSLPAAQPAPPPVPHAVSPIPPSRPEAPAHGKAMTREELDTLKARVARGVAEADAAKAAKDAKWNFAATAAEIFRATTPGYDRP